MGGILKILNCSRSVIAMVAMIGMWGRDVSAPVHMCCGGVEVGGGSPLTSERLWADQESGCDRLPTALGHKRCSGNTETSPMRGGEREREGECCPLRTALHAIGKLPPQSDHQDTSLSLGLAILQREL